MRPRFLIASGVIAAVSIAGCSRVPSARHDPVQEPINQALDGDAGAQYEVGVRIVASPATTPDYPQAVRWFHRAADQGHAGAQAALGFLYHRGQGVPRNDDEAIKWLTLAASQPAAEHEAYALWLDYVRRASGRRPPPAR